MLLGMATNPLLPLSLYDPTGQIFAIGTLISPGFWLAAGTASHVQQQNVESCLRDLGVLREEVPLWISSTFAEISVAQVIEDELRLRMASKGFEKHVVPITFAEGDWDIDDFKEIARQAGTPIVIIGYVFLESYWGLDDGRCGIRFDFNVPLRAIVIDPPNRDLAYQYVSVERRVSDSKVFQKWAENPDLAREWVREALRELAARIASTYIAP